MRDLLAGLARRFHPDLLVIACNTASTVALPAVREALTVPIVGTVPAIKPAAQGSVTRVIGLLGTPGTVRRQYTQALIDEFAPDCTVLRHGSAELVELAEQKLRGESIAPAAVKRALAGLFDQPGGERIDTVVLACTHFPLLAAELAAGAPRLVHWIDSGTAIARRVAALLDGRCCRGERGRAAAASRHFYRAYRRGREAAAGAVSARSAGNRVCRMMDARDRVVNPP